MWVFLNEEVKEIKVDAVSGKILAFIDVKKKLMRPKMMQINASMVLHYSHNAERHI